MVGRSRQRAHLGRGVEAAQEATHHCLLATHEARYTRSPPHTKKDGTEATGWIREALSAGRFLFVEGDKRFPKHVWHEDADGGCWIGRCVNSLRGEYKGWPVQSQEIAVLERKKSQNHEV